MSEKSAPASLLSDLRRMAPVWLIVCTTAVVAVFAMRSIGERHLREAVEASSNACEYSRIYMARGMVLMERIRGGAAPVILESIRPGDPTLGILSGNEDLAEARNAFSRVRELCPIEAEASMQLAVLEWYDGRETESYLHLGDFLLATNRNDEAIITYQVTLDQDPRSMEAMAGLAVALVDAGRVEEAREVADANSATLMESPRGLFALGSVEAAAGNHAVARDHLKTMLLANPSHVRAIRLLFRLSNHTEWAGETADFLANLEESGLRTHVEGFHLAALLYNEVGNYEGAERALRRALVLSPHQIVLHFDHAVSLHRLGRRNAARDALRRALEIDSAWVMRMIEESGVDPRS